MARYWPTTYLAAKAAGQRYYRSDRPCRRGHMADRYVSTKQCTECHKAFHAARDENAERDRKRDVMRRRRADPEKRAKERAAQLSPKGRAQMKIRYNRRRARLAEAFVEDVSIEYLIERDGGCCKLCGDLLSLDTKFPHPKSPQADHIIPLTKGGLHERANLQLACYACNLSKGNRLVDEWRRQAS